MSADFTVAMGTYVTRSGTIGASSLVITHSITVLMKIQGKIAYTAGQRGVDPSVSSCSRMR